MADDMREVGQATSKDDFSIGSSNESSAFSRTQSMTSSNESSKESSIFSRTKSSPASTNKSSTKRNFHSSCATTLGTKFVSRHDRLWSERKPQGDAVSPTRLSFLQRDQARWEARQVEAQGILELQREAGKASRQRRAVSVEACPRLVKRSDAFQSIFSSVRQPASASNNEPYQAAIGQPATRLSYRQIRFNERSGSVERHDDGNPHGSIEPGRQQTRAQSEESTEPRHTCHSIDLMAPAPTGLLSPKLPRPTAAPLPQQAGAARLFRRTCSEPTSGNPASWPKERSTSPKDSRRTSSTIAISAVRRALSTVFVRVSSLGRGNSM